MAIIRAHHAHGALAGVQPLLHGVGFQGAHVAPLCQAGDTGLVRRPVSLLWTRLARAVVPKPAPILHHISGVRRQKHFLAPNYREHFGSLCRDPLHYCCWCYCQHWLTPSIFFRFWLCLPQSPVARLNEPATPLKGHPRVRGDSPVISRGGYDSNAQTAIFYTNLNIGRIISHYFYILLI